MLQQLNQYLFQFRALALPSFGTIKLVAQPARLDVVEHKIYAPAYEPQFSTDENWTAHQLEFFAAALQKEEADVEAFFRQAGETLKRQAQAGTLDWSGIGTFNYNNQQLQFYPQANPALAPVEANKVMRENVQHSVLVGDQVVISDPTAERVEEESRRNFWTLAAWIIALLAVLFIAYYLYQNHFSPQASGRQTKVQPAQPAPTWQ